MKKTGWLLTGLILLCLLPKAQTLDWVVGYGGSENELVYDTEIDAAGNIYVLGSFRDSVDFDPGPQVDLHVGNSSGNTYLSKFDPNGNRFWTVTWTAATYIFPEAMHIKANGHLLITGAYNGLVDFNPGSGTLFQTGGGSFIVELDAAGTFIRRGVIEGNCWGFDVSSNSNGDVALAGEFIGNIDFDPGPGVLFKMDDNVGVFDGYLIQLDSNFNLLWSRFMECDSTIRPHELHTDASDNIYLHGNFSGSMVFDPGGAGQTITLTSPRHGDFMVKLSPGGALRWHGEWSNNIGVLDYAAIAFDDTDGIYIAGTTGKIADLDPSSGVQMVNCNLVDQYLLKIDTTGAYQWHRFEEDTSGSVYPRDVHWYNGQVIVVGNSYGTADVDHGPGVDTIQAASFATTTIQVLDANGFHQSVGASRNNNLAKSVMDSNGKVYIGSYYASASVDADPGPNVVSLSHFGGWDNMLARYTLPAPTGRAEAHVGSLDIWPNPSTGTVHLKTTAQGGSLELLDLQGRVLERQQKVGHSASMSIDRPAGLYFLRFTDRMGNSLVQRLVLR